MEYIVIMCSNCQELTFIRSNQKNLTCKKCGTKNQFKKLEKFANTKQASEYIKLLKTPPLFNP